MSANAYGGADRHQDLAGLSSPTAHPQYALVGAAAGAVASVVGAYVVPDNSVGIVIAGGTTAYTVTLQAAAGNSGRVVTVKRTSTGNITVAAAGGNVEGAATAVLTTQYASITLASDGTNWWVV